MKSYTLYSVLNVAYNKQYRVKVKWNNLLLQSNTDFLMDMNCLLEKNKM